MCRRRWQVSLELIDFLSKQWPKLLVDAYKPLALQTRQNIWCFSLDLFRQNRNKASEYVWQIYNRWRQKYCPVRCHRMGRNLKIYIGY